MTERANPSVNRPAGAFKTAGAIAYGGSDEGFISPENSPTEISIQDASINETQLNAFNQASSGSSLDVTILGGEAFVFGSWLAIDTQTTVTLESNTAGQTVFVGWNKNGSDDVIVGLEDAFSTASGDADQKIPLFSFDTDGSGVTNSVDERSFDQISVDSIEQGPGSGLDADTLDGVEASALGGGDIANDGSIVTSSTDEIDFTTGITASDDGDGTNTVELTADHSDLSNISADDHHTKYTDSEAVDAVNAEATLSVDISGDADTLDSEDATSFVSVSGDTMSGSLDMGSNRLISIADPTSAQDAVTKSFADSTFVDAAGDTMSGDLDMGGLNTVTNLDNPSSNTDAATKEFVESVAQGLTIKDSVRVSNHDIDIDLSSSTDPNPIDGLTLNDGDRILLKHQTDLSENGIYDAVTATDPTTWVRSSDFDENAEVTQGTFTFVRGGTHANESHVVISEDPISVGVDDIEFAQFSAAGQLSGGQNVSVSGDIIDVSPQGPGSGLDADTLDGTELEDISEGYKTAVTKTSDHTAIDRQVILADATSNEVNITLPSPTDGQLITVKKIDSTNNSVNILTPGGETIDGQGSISLTNQFATRETVSNGSDYFII